MSLKQSVAFFVALALLFGCSNSPALTMTPTTPDRTLAPSGTVVTSPSTIAPGSTPVVPPPTNLAPPATQPLITAPQATEVPPLATDAPALATQAPFATPPPAATPQPLRGSTLQSHDVPLEGVAGQLDVFSGGASGEDCGSPHRSEPTVTTGINNDWLDTNPHYPREAPEIGLTFIICFLSFLPGQEIQAQVTRPDGVTFQRPIPLGNEPDSEGRWEWSSLPGDPTGEYTVSAVQGALHVTSRFIVGPAVVPRTLVFPNSGPPGTAFQVGLAGFQPNQIVALRLYRQSEDGQFWQYITLLPPVQVNEQGLAITTLRTLSDDAEGSYLVDTSPVARDPNKIAGPEQFFVQRLVQSPGDSAQPSDAHLMPLTLYFADKTSRALVSVQRNLEVENNRVARAAIRALVSGPWGDLRRLVPPDIQLLDITITGGTATVNFDQLPTYTATSGLDAMALTLTEFPTVQRVQFQVHGQNAGGSIGRPILNPLNPQGLPADANSTLFLPVYFPSIDGAHDIRLTRFVPPTNQVAGATVRALLEGPGEYRSALQRVVPTNTELRDIRLENGVLTVDFSRPFADTQDRAAAVRTLVESLTTWKTVHGVQFLVEGRSLAEHWGANYGAVFERPPINPE